MKKSDNFLSDFLFFCTKAAQVRNMGGLGRLRRMGRYEQQAPVGSVAVALNYS